MDMTRYEKAMELRSKGYNCCQSVLAAFSDRTGLDDQTAFNLAAGFGAGTGTGELCGALSGSAMVLGLTHPVDPADPAAGKRRAMGLSKQAQKEVKERFGSVRCADLLKTELPPELSPAAQEMGLTNRCEIQIVNAIQRVEALLQEEA